MRSKCYVRMIGLAAILSAAGCGGADLLSSSGRSGGLDSGLGGNYSGYGNSYGGGFNNGGFGGGRQGGYGPRGRGTYPKVESSFELPEIKGNPFDYTENDVIVTFSAQDGHTVKIPAFYDGGKSWRVRYTPDTSGKLTLTAVSLNGKPIQPDKMEKRDFDVSGSQQPGFVRRDTRDKTRFAFDNGNSYFPIGHNQAESDLKSSEIAARMEKMGKAGENWSRIWMSHWDGRNLDWVEKQKSEPGKLDLEVAKRWDEIVEAADKAGVRFQMVLQHHGQYSTHSDANWEHNPWNKKNGGWLSTPDEFFTNPRALAQTKAKYRYIIARWGYSTAIMAWELFNEVESTDSFAHQHQDEIAAWHRAMAVFIRQHDPYKHLITTSSDIQLAAMWQEMDYYQPHRYTSDPFSAAVLTDPRKLDKPIFFGEFGPSKGSGKDRGEWLRSALWAGTVSGAGGAPQYWAWTEIEKNNLYDVYRSTADFARQSGLWSKHGLLPAAVGVETKERAPLTFSPGAGWASTKQTEYTISPNGTVDGLSSMPRFLQGSGHREMFSAAHFKVNFAEAGTFTVKLAQVSRSGAHVILTVDAQTGADKEFSATDKDTSPNVTLEAKIPAGQHDIKLENTGLDWVEIDRFTLSSYAPALRVLGQSSKDYGALWISNRSSGEVGGKLLLSGLQQGTYKLSWWDTEAGKSLSEDSATVTGAAPLTITVAPIKSDVALYVSRSGEKTAAKVTSGTKVKTE